MENIIIVVILAAIVGGVVWYLCKAKKSCEKCIGCPHARQCADKRRCEHVDPKGNIGNKHG